MTISFAPRRGTILMCDFGDARVPPEMEKLRRAVVVSDTTLNHRHGRAPGLCTVVPFSGTPPHSPRPCDVFIPVGRYRSLTIDVWAKCAMLTNVSHERLDRIQTVGGYRNTEDLNAEDMLALEDALRSVLRL
ncbi:type II toxin-antitoxin system PemK/MazF family toxin [Ancylobacter radicis]|uniref:Type II toxin-antitoxin system PemK/MazF family toxin n=1 Tax=Ancylobacter radicis TaxID=2836179 RepID=A0ABS5RBG3_9HYPH|nr:type II toxin-antitoxin system PemK/MazF family toxin [Ancylobacter radicis]MBS9478988.1 type II toxin-antitoxin system PemK/MazF family toxin [Ancylobacter radicis]